MSERPAGFDPTRFYSAQQLAAAFAINLTTVWRWSRRGVLPKPRKLAANTTRWFGGDLVAHLNKRDANGRA